MAYKLWSYRLIMGGQERIFPSIRNAAIGLNGMLGSDCGFTVQVYGPDGEFDRAFGGRARRGEIEYNGWTSNNHVVKTDMTDFKRYFLNAR